MKRFSWNPEKNKKLQAERRISFNDAVYFIENGGVLDIIDHPNHERYKHQKIYILLMRDYVYLVPFVDNEIERFLKTIIPSRKLTQQYLRGVDNDKA